MRLLIIGILSSLIGLSQSFASKVESEYDTELNCHPTDVNASFRTFSLRLRETSSGVKMVRESVSVAPNMKEFSTLEVSPRITYNDTKIQILSGIAVDRASLKIERNHPTLWQGQIKFWKATHNVNGTQYKIYCFASLEHNNGMPTINN